MTASIAELFEEGWAEQVAKNLERSPSFFPEQYTATGRASAAYGGKRTIAWWLDNGPLMVESWVNWRANTGWTIWDVAGKPAIEMEVNFSLPGLDLPIKAFIDRIMILPTGELAILDIKTGRAPETPEQLGLYRVGVGIVHGVWVDWGYWWNPERGHSQPYDLRKYTPQYFSRLFNEATNGVNARSFLPTPANGCSRWCGVARYCAAVDGPEAPTHDPLLI